MIITTCTRKYKNGGSPLHTVSACNNPLYIKLLLDYGADASIKDIQGKTAYDLANVEGRYIIDSYFVIKEPSE